MPPPRRLDLGPADVHVDGATSVKRRVRCAQCGESRGWGRDEVRSCVACGSPFFEPPPWTATGPLAPPHVPKGQPAPPSTEDPGTWIPAHPIADEIAAVPVKTTFADLTPRARKKLERSQFALPEQKKYPIHDASHVRDAEGRLEQAKKANTVTPADYRKARRAIARAAKRFGVKSEYLERDGSKSSTSPAPGFRVAVHTHPSGSRRVEITHASDAGGGTRVMMSDRVHFTAGCGSIDATPYVEALTKLRDAETKLAGCPAESPDRAALEAAAVTLREEAVAPRWNQVARVGRFLGHPSGPFELTPAIFDEIVRNFENVDGGSVPIDFEHASEADETAGSIPQEGAPAAGWVKRLENRGAEGLWGLTHLLEPALTYVREGRYKNFSPAIRFGAKHPETAQPIGARLTSVALVTRPFLREMQPLAARDSTMSGASITMSLPATHPEMMSKLKACMKLGDLSTPSDMKDSIAKLREHAKEILDKPVQHAVGHYSAGGVHCGDYLPQLAEAVNTPANTSVGEILDACEDMIDAAMERHVAEMHTMADQTPADPAALATALGETKATLRMRDGEVRTLGEQKAALELKLKDADAQVVALQAEKVTLGNELKTLRDAEIQRVEASITADVDEAFATYKDVKKLSDHDKKAMAIVRKSDPATFTALYPKVAATQQHLLRDLTTHRNPAGPVPPLTAPGASPGGATPLTPADQVKLTDKLLAANPKMTREQAIGAAFLVATGQAQMPAFPS
jgi:Mu-like prophage I protein/Family of unknown function (DUF6582)